MNYGNKKTPKKPTKKKASKKKATEKKPKTLSKRLSKRY
jgi:hypothetical protein